MQASHAPSHHDDVVRWIIFVLLGLLTLGVVLGCEGPGGFVPNLAASVQMVWRAL